MSGVDLVRLRRGGWRVLLIDRRGSGDRSANGTALSLMARRARHWYFEGGEDASVCRVASLLFEGGVHQVAHPRAGDRQRPGLPRTAQPEAELHLPGRHALLRRGLQHLKFRLIVRRPEVLDLSRPAMRGPHDLHRDRVLRGLHCPHIRHQATLRAAPSAQVQLSRTVNPHPWGPVLSRGHADLAR